MKRRFTSPATRETQIETTTRGHFTPARAAITKHGESQALARTRRDHDVCAALVGTENGEAA